VNLAAIEKILIVDFRVKTLLYAKFDIYRNTFYIIGKTEGTFWTEHFTLIQIIQDVIQHHQWKFKITRSTKWRIIHQST
jgi:hypothetical protein